MTDVRAGAGADGVPQGSSHSGPTMFELVSANARAIAELRAEVAETRRATGAVLEALTAALGDQHDRVAARLAALESAVTATTASSNEQTGERLEQVASQLDDVDARLRLIIG